LFPETALVTGGASGIGRAIVGRLEAGGAEVRVLDLQDGFDVADPAAWDSVEAVDLACLNAGVVTGERDVREVSDNQYRRILGTNVDGVVFGVRRLARIQEPGSAIVVTASLAGLTPVESDPIYAGTKHFLIGFVRSIAPHLESRRISINAVCPGVVDTPILGEKGRARMRAEGFPLLRPEEVAEAVVAAVEAGGTGEAWVCQPGRDPKPYQFRGVPGPRTPGAEGKLPPL
jgi:NAD(P)-dependent dehydrogenase (short-subunit alcohol dehydrogenase family)